MTIFTNPNSPSTSTVLELQKCLLQGFKSVKQLKHVHTRLLRLGLHQDNYLINMILRSCFDSGDTNYTRVLFKQIKEPNVYLWNTMIRGFVSKDDFHEALKLYGLMRRESFLPNNFTFPFVLKACARLSDLKLGLKIHTLVVKAGFDFDVFVKTSLVCLYAKCGYLKDAFNIFNDIPVKNIVSWTAIISGYLSFNRFEEVIDMFERMLSTGLKPDSFTLVRVLSACTHLGDLKSGERIHRYIFETDSGRNVFVATSLVDMYAKCGSMDRARTVFDKMPEKDIVTWSVMIMGYASNGLPKEALDLFFQMRRENLEPDCYSMVGVLSACARLGALKLGDWVSSLIDYNGFLSNSILGTALIDFYAKCGSMSRAWRIFREMKERDLVLWNAAISGLAMNGHVKAAFGLFAQIEKFGLRPDENTFMGLLCGCTHAGLIDDGRRYFNSITHVFSLTPTIEHYGCMVDLLGRAGLLDEAHELTKKMPMEPNAVVLGALLGGCRLHKDAQLAEHVLRKLIEIEPSNSGNYVLLSNIYSANCRWDDAADLRSIMKERGIQKTRGCSWIEVDGVVHEFLVGENSHPLTEKIYAKLEELGKELKAEGYVPTTEFVLFDIEEEEKEHILGCHSEKLAIAFGLICVSSKDVIRVVKNLRVCGDCHLAIKLISRITGREIIVRDNNRFHCFVDGSCSCKDYW